MSFTKWIIVQCRSTSIPAAATARREANSAFPNTHDFDPRVSLAYAPAGFHCRAVLRTGFGILHGDGQLDDQNLPIANDVQRFNLTRIGFPDLSHPINPFLNQAVGVVTPRLLDRNRKDMYLAEWGASLQEDLGSGTVGTISYVASKGTHLLTTATSMF